jgi:nitrous oxide reductase accessory protein NosL
MMKRFLFAVLLVPLVAAACSASREQAAAPNLVIIFADDVGYGAVLATGR